MKGRIFWEQLRDARLAVQLAKRLWQEEEGQDLAEYGLLVLLIALSAIASMQNIASAISGIFGSAATSLTSST